MKTHKALHVLKSILNGIPVKIGVHTYCMSDNYELLIEGRAMDIKTGETRITYLYADISIGAFFRMVDKEMTEDDIFGVTANMVFNDK